MKADLLRLGLLSACLMACGVAPSASAQTRCTFYSPPTVLFAEDSDVPREPVADRLDAVYAMLYQCPGYGLLLTGTADSSEVAPQALAERRAATVAAAFVADGFSADRFAAVGGGIGEARNATVVTLEAVPLHDLPGWTPRGSTHEPDAFQQDLWGAGGLWLDWAQDPDGCAGEALGSGRLVLKAVRYGEGAYRPQFEDIQVGCVRSALPGARYTPSLTAEVTRDVTVIDGTMGEGRGALAVGWLVGPTGSVQTDGRFCARYLTAYGDALGALSALAETPGDAAAEAAVGTAVDALWPFVDAVASVGGEVQVMALDCRQLVFYEQAL